MHIETSIVPARDVRAGDVIISPISQDLLEVASVDRYITRGGADQLTIHGDEFAVVLLSERPVERVTSISRYGRAA